jgi:hypothetical protein
MLGVRGLVWKARQSIAWARDCVQALEVKAHECASYSSQVKITIKYNFKLAYTSIHCCHMGMQTEANIVD